MMESEHDIKNFLLIAITVAFVIVCIAFVSFALTTDESAENVTEETLTTEIATENSEEPGLDTEKEPVSVSEDGAVVVDNQSLIELANDKIAAGYEVVAEINGMVMEHSPEDEIVITEDTITRFDVLVDYSNMVVILRMKKEYVEETFQ